MGFRDLGAKLSCNAGIGSRVWTALTGRQQPAELHPFREIAGARHTAVSTPGDVMFHIRADRQDFCFEFERLLLDQFGGSVTVADEVFGFRYFDARDPLGFVDGTANPVGLNLPESTLVGSEDAEFAGGSYLVVQKYLHPLADWQALTVEQQEAIIGRTKLDDVELPDAVSGQKSHKTLSTITDEQGEHDILRDNMPFGRPGGDEFGTYFIGYTRRLWVLERMLERMFIGDPPGLHDRILDFSTAVTGCTFFVPPASMLSDLDQVPDTAPAARADGSGADPAADPTTDTDPDAHPSETQPSDAPSPDDSDNAEGLGLGSLKNLP